MECFVEVFARDCRRELSAYEAAYEDRVGLEDLLVFGDGVDHLHGFHVDTSEVGEGAHIGANEDIAQDFQWKTVQEPERMLWIDVVLVVVQRACVLKPVFVERVVNLNTGQAIGAIGELAQRLIFSQVRRHVWHM